MTISKKWSAAAVGVLSLALVAGGAAAANAAPANPQTNPAPYGTGSKGSFYLYNADTGEIADGDTNRVYQRNEPLIASASGTDVLAEINPSATRPVTGGTAFTGVYVFLSDPNTAAVNGGLNTWKANHVDGASGANGGTLTPDFTLNSLANGIDTVIGQGGTYWYGVAYTINAGVTTVGATYRQITITAGTGEYTVGPIQEEAVTEAPVITTTSLGTVTKDVAFSKTIEATGSTPITWSVSAGSLPTGLNLDAATGVVSGTPTVTGAYNFTLKAANGTAPDDEQVFSGIVGQPIVKPTDATHAATKVAIADPAEGATTVKVPAGIAHANGTLHATGWSAETDLGSAPTDAAGDATVTVTGLAPGETHTIALTEPGDATNTIIAWGTVTLAGDPVLTDDVDLKAVVTASNLWALNAESTQVDFGNVVRGGAPVTKALGNVTVIDDRNVLKGWDLDASWTKFTKGTDEIAADALTIAPNAVDTLIPGITLGTTPTKIAQSTAVSTLPAGKKFGADLTFAAPGSAQAGEYHSTLTLTLTSK